ncbi:MAG: protein-L-isoaspartate O-methyltransferase [Candidatus Veblenbacteria bacterium]|nr:protein-L-isoaspartate O-methyltransferase [Candidatus Veblenbacteria bacterium]
MAFTSNSELVASLVSSGVLQTPRLRTAFLAVDRARFVPLSLRAEAYADHPLPIGLGQTISQPTTIAFMLELLQPPPGGTILEVGAGSGYVAALLAEVVGKSGRVVAMEHVPELAQRAEQVLRTFNFPQLAVVARDGSHGYAQFAPYDRILVSAAAQALPSVFEAQLGKTSRLVIPVGGGIQDIVLVRYQDSLRQEKHYPGFVFVPLLGNGK